MEPATELPDVTVIPPPAARDRGHVNGAFEGPGAHVGLPYNIYNFKKS